MEPMGLCAISRDQVRVACTVSISLAHGHALGIAQVAPQRLEIADLVPVDADGGGTEAFLQVIFDSLDGYDMVFPVLFSVGEQVVKAQGDVRQNEVDLVDGARRSPFALDAEIGGDPDEGGERGALGLDARRGAEHQRHVAVGALGAGQPVAVGAEHVGGECTRGLTIAAPLRAFVLAGVELVEGVAGRRHHRLDGVGQRGLAGAVAAGEQGQRPHCVFAVGQGAPVDGDYLVDVHLSPLRRRS
ncbi:hypothetical protein QVG61_09050 [Thiohalobacter sp. IOR34]|nr:hypothetical protein [Thiohalobacter sp. IOR34]WJW74650.1 hypothetical protein QVG61_09050 [Thiohalobacter sp. IOR34]